MNKKGVQMVPALIVTFALLLVVLIIMLTLQQRGVGKFTDGTEQAQNDFFRCYCEAGSGNICSLANPTTVDKKYSERSMGSCTKWTDCSTTCWEKTP